MNIELLAEANSRAAVLVSTDENYILPSKFASSINEVPYPLIIVKSSDGEEIMQYFRSNKGENIYAKIDNDRSQTLVIPQAGNCMLLFIYRIDMNIYNFFLATMYHWKGMLYKFAQYARGKGTESAERAEVNLKAIIKAVMFADKKPVIISDSIIHIEMVMSAFHNYECSGTKGYEISDIFKKLKNHYWNVDDFPFYILLVYRIHK